VSDDLRELRRRRDVLEGMLAIERELESERLDEQLRRAGFEIPQRPRPSFDTRSAAEKYGKILYR
jgi:hypothetical protein